MKLFTDWIENCESFAAAEGIGESAAIVCLMRKNIYSAWNIFTGKEPLH